MPKIKRKRHKVDTGKDEDIEVKIGSLRVYFQNWYSIISLINDFLLGIVYTMGSVVNLVGWPSIYSTYLFLAGGVFLTFRPILSIMRNISVYKNKDYIESEFENELKENEETNTEYSAEYKDGSSTDGQEESEEEEESS